ncbi:unnamed protein product [Hyaloperonospora brassicae]|nr:unnamed protein product [Hyaloperonospora brassicae]
MVVCEYSPAGNDGESEWFVHHAQAMHCPDGTVASNGLCIVEGDKANDLIAPIPDDKRSDQVYPTFVADIMETILEAAKARDAPGANSVAITTGGNSSSSSSYDSTLGADPEQTSLGTSDSATSDLTDDTLGFVADSSSSTASSADQTSADIEGGLDATFPSDDATATPSSSIEDGSTSQLSELLPTQDSETAMSGEGTTDSSSLSEYSPSLETTLDGEKDSTLADTGYGFEPSTESSVADSEAITGKVKPSFETGSSFGNQETESATSGLDSTYSTDTGEQEDPTVEEGVTEPTEDEVATLPVSSDLESVSALSVDNESPSFKSKAPVSAAAFAGMAVAGVVAVVALAVFVSYRKNQQRQRDIMYDGGIHVI